MEGGVSVRNTRGKVLEYRNPKLANDIDRKFKVRVEVHGWARLGGQVDSEVVNPFFPPFPPLTPHSASGR